MEIQGYPDYLIYQNGKVFSKKRTVIRSDGMEKTYGGKYLKASVNTQGYLCVNLKGTPNNIHRLLVKH